MVLCKMVLLSCKPNIFVVVYSFFSLVKALIEQEIVNSLKIKYSVVEKKEYTFFPQQGNDLTIPCDVVDGYQQISDWYKVMIIYMPMNFYLFCSII